MEDDTLIWVDDFAIVDDYFGKPADEDGGSSLDNDSTSLIPSTLSDNQERVLSILLVVAATLSTIGSGSIVYKIIRDKQFSKPYHRTMLALSASDVIASLTYGSYPFLMPKGVRVWTIGNQATCTILGSLSQFSFVAIGYNCILSFYYLLAIKYNIKRKRFILKYEKPMHAINLLYFLITATVGLIYQFYSPVDVGFGCWVNNWPENCNLTGDCVSQLIAIVFAGVPVSFFFLAIVINHIVVYRHVRHIFKSLDKVYAAQEEKEREKANISYWDEHSNQHSNNNNSQDQTKPERKGLTAKEAIAARKITNQSELYEQKLQEVALQAVLYVGSFLISYTPALATRIVETLTYNYDDAKIYWLLVITAMTLPLQGFFNMFIYNRPHYVRIKEAHPNLPTLKAMHAAFLESKSLALSSWQSGGGSGGGNRSADRKRPSKGRFGGVPGKNRGSSSGRFSAVGGSLEVVMEEPASQMSEDDDDDERSVTFEKESSMKRLDTGNTTTDNESTINDTDNDNSEYNNSQCPLEVEDDGPIVRSPVPPEDKGPATVGSTMDKRPSLDPPPVAVNDDEDEEEESSSSPTIGRIDMTGTITTQPLDTPSSNRDEFMDSDVDD